MKVSVYDTYVPKDEKTTMHFDILVADNDSMDNVYRYGKEYLNKKGVSNFQLTAKECNFCHMEAAPENIASEIRTKGYYIIEMENC